MTRVLVIGLDSAAPELVYDRFRGELSNLASLMDEGTYGFMESCHPPITVPAWAVMVTGREPGELGMYGFRHRRVGSYDKTYVVSSLNLREPAVWDLAGSKGLRCCVVGVPPGYPPRKVNGCWVSCFITPSPKKQYTYPPGLKEEIERVSGGYVFDVEFRVEERDRVLKGIYEMTEKHFKVVEYLLKRGKWDFFMFVEIGLDRVHHAFWKYFDEKHHLYVPGNKYEHVVEEYYKYLDQWVGRLLKLVGNDTVTLVVSDHGAKGMRGAFCVNEWLIDMGYLVLKEKPAKRGVDLEKLKVNWEKTKAWAWGGYYARVFLNVKGREPRGVIEPGEYESFRGELADELKRLTDPSGRRMDTRVYKPEELYRRVKGDPPDLMVYFDDLYWRSAGTLGHNTLYLPENDKGPDDAVHSMYGVFIAYDPEERFKQGKKDVSIYDVAPTILELLGLPIPSDLRGKPIVKVF